MTIKAPKVDVLMMNGDELQAQLGIPDQIQWSKTARARGWAADDELLAQTFMVWHSLHRTGQYAGTWDEFSTTDASWVAEHEDETETEVPSEQDPTDPVS
jgi:hypothetical protein